MKKISLSILSADLSNIQQLVTSLVNNGINRIHLDIMDGFFVPNLTIGPDLCRVIKKYKGNAELDVHLMVKNTAQAIDWFKDIADIISIHPEAGGHLDRYIQTIKSCGIKAGVAINPATSLNDIEYLLYNLDLVTIMSVNPGFGGQKFIPSQYDKIIQLKQMLITGNLQQQVEIQIDGGVNLNNIKELMQLGVESCVVGSAIFNYENYLEKIIEFNAIINQEFA
jgi:ribulose-phosphate 3-epimerase